jgi:hypothetical protein
MSLPTFARSIPVEVATQPASTRTSFTRVDHTRPGTSAGDDGQRDEAGPNDEAARASLRDEPEGQEAASIPQIPQTMLQFLLVSGRRRSMVFEPETTVGRVKELVWNTWPNGVSRSRSPLFFALVDCLSILSPMHGIADAVFASPHPAASRFGLSRFFVGGKGGL